jgi:type IV secretion system protein TrbL
VTDTGVIDQFLDVFSRYIDSGFGLVHGDVASLSRILVALDVTLAALFWAWGPGEELLARLVRKVLYVGTFAFLLSNFQALAQEVYDSFARLGIEAAGSPVSPADLMHPGHIAAAGVDAVRPLLAAVGDLAGFPSIFENFVQVAVILASVLVVLAAFFVLAVVVLEFKLTTLAGFVLVPFGLFGRTAFLAERVLGSVMATGVKVLVLAVIVGIGSTLFSGFVADFGGAQPTLDQALAIALGALSLLGLGIFGPGIAAGLVSGAPHLGAGAAVGTALGVGGAAMAGAGLVRGAAGAVGSAMRGGGAAAAGVVGRLKARTSGDGGPPASGAEGGAGGPPSPSPTGPGGGAGGGAAAREAPAAEAAPAWARKLRRSQAISAGVSAAANAVRSGDHSGGSAAVPLDEEKP